MNATKLKGKQKTSVDQRVLVKTSMGVTGASAKKDTLIMATKGLHAQVSACIHDWYNAYTVHWISFLTQMLFVAVIYCCLLRSTLLFVRQYLLLCGVAFCIFARLHAHLTYSVFCVDPFDFRSSAAWVLQHNKFISLFSAPLCHVDFITPLLSVRNEDHSVMFYFFSFQSLTVTKAPAGLHR